jgi:putative cell wall-binding protein
LKYEGKRAAKRLAAGLAAAGMAIGALAISGASPVSAVTPTTSRIAGVDRYDTSVKLAEARLAGGNAEHIVFVSGENYPDALAAAGYAGKLNKGVAPSDAIMLLTSAASLPATVQNFLSNASNLGAGLKTYIVGGTSAISAATATQIASLTGTTPTRISGDSRYASAVALSTANGTTSDFIVVSGTGFADGVAAAAWAYATGFPVLLAGASGLDTATAAEVKRITTATAGAKAFIVGGASAVPSAVESQLIDNGVKYSNIKRIAGDDRYATASALNTYLATTPVAPFNGSKIALITGLGFADALAAAPFLGTTGNHPVLMPASGIPASVAGLAAALAPSNPASAVAIGGTAAVSNDTVTAVKSAVSGLTVATPVIAALTKGAATTTFTIEKSPVVVGAAPGACATPLACGTGDTAAKWLVDEGNWTVNSIPLAAFASGGVAVTTPAAAAGAKLVITITLPTGFSTAGTTVAFKGIGEGKASDTGNVSIAAATATIADDTTAPTATAVDLAARAAGTAYLTFSETVTVDLTKVSVKTSAGVAKCAGAGANALSLSAATGLFKCDDAAAVALAAGDVITLAAEALTDVAGNKSAATTFTIAAADTTKPTLSRGANAVTTTATTASTFSVNLTAGGPLVFSSLAGSPFHGQGGIGWRLVLTSTTSKVPSIAVDTATKRINLTVNFTASDADDIIAALNNTPAVSALLSASGGGAGKLATSFISGDQITPQSGQSTTKVVLTASELLSAVDVSKITNGTCSGLAAALGADLKSVDITCTANAAAVAGNFVLTAAAVTDLSGNTSDAVAAGV